MLVVVLPDTKVASAVVLSLVVRCVYGDGPGCGGAVGRVP